mgnify:FL=1|tara:strand:- start:626 stop:1555 length:930 start_codon:yes stop_codon:yes gene_type:complete
MKRGFVLISTLALIVILSFLVLIISRTIYTDTLRTTFYAESMEKRIQIINYESLLVDLLIDNSTLNRNLLFAENEINLILKDKFDGLSVSIEDYSTCFNLNSLVKPFQNIYIKNEVHGELFENFLELSQVEKIYHNELINRLYDAIDTDSLPETYGAEDLFYVSNEELSLSPDDLFIHKSQIKNLQTLNNNLFQIYDDICALPENEIKFNINSLSIDNAKVFLSLFPDITLKEVELIILNRPENGYVTLKNLVDYTNIDSEKLNKSFIIFKPEFIKIKYMLQLENQMFNFISLLKLQRNNFVVYRTISV